jgi:hypothetical protein
MTGAFLILMIIIIIIGFFLKQSYTYDELGNILFYGGMIFFIILLIAIPISRIDSKTNAESIKQFQIVLTESRTLEKSSEFERIKIIDKVDDYNNRIAQWKTKGQHWYNNKWYYSKDCQNVDYLK